MDIEAIVGLASTFLVITIVLYRLVNDIRKFKNSSKLEAKIIGYKWAKSQTFQRYIHSKPAGFWPVIQYDQAGETITTPIENLAIIIPETNNIKIRLSDNKKEHVELDFLFSLFPLAFILAIFSMIFLGNKHILDLFLLSVLIILTIHVKDSINNFGTWQNVIQYIHPRRPKNYKDMTDHDSLLIEQKELVSYEEAMAHYYYKGKKSNRWLYVIIIATIAAFICYKLLL